MIGRANRPIAQVGDARRSLARTCAYGAALGVGAFAVFLGAAWALGAFDGYGIFWLRPALLFGPPIAAIVGAVCAALLLPRRGRALRRALWISVLTVPVTLVLGIAAAYTGKALQQKLESAQMLRTVTANYSGHWIRNVKLLDPGCQGDNAEVAGVAPVAAGISVPLTIERVGTVTPAWDTHRTLALSWFRPLHGTRFDEMNLQAPAALVHAEVSLPPYRGTIGKVFILVFLPDDKVRVEAVAASGFDGQVSKPNDDQYVAQGSAQTCAAN